MADDAMFAALEASENPKTDNMTTDQLVDHAMDVHKDTTATALRALQQVNQTTDLAKKTAETLKAQGEQLDRVEDGVDAINDDLDKAKGILDFMAKCFCIQFILPEQDDKEKTKTGKKQQAAEKRVPGQAKSGRTKHLDPDVTLGTEFAAAEAALKDETSKQNDIIDQIFDGVEGLHAIAVGMGEELDNQLAKIDNIEKKVDVNIEKLKKLNNHKMLREFDV